MKALKIHFSVSLLALVAANTVPLFGVLFLGWDAAVIVLLYWAENVIIGAYNVLKIIFLKAPSPAFHLGKLFAIPFFCIHFGGFCAVHGLFLLALLKVGGGPESVFSGSGITWFGPLVFVQLLFNVVISLWRDHPVGMEWPVIALVVSHGVSFVQNYLLKGEYKSFTVQELMGQPYKRIVIMHVAILAGAAPIMILGSPVLLLCILVFLKIVMDIHLHVKERGVGAKDRPQGSPDPHGIAASGG